MRAIDADELIVQFRRAIETFLPNDPRKHMDLVDSLKCHGWEQGLMVKQNASTVQLESFWIPVKYNPKKDGRYLITIKREDGIFVDALDYNSEMGWGFYPDWGDGFISMPDVIAWMPVPEPYKGVEE